MVGRIRADDVQAVGAEVEIVSRLTINWRPEYDDPRVDGDPVLDEQAEQRDTLDDHVLKGWNELLRLILASERSPRSQVTGWRRTSRRECGCRLRLRRSVWTSSLGNRAPFMRTDTCRNGMDCETLRIGGSLRSSDDLVDDGEGMSTGEEGLVVIGYSNEHVLPGLVS